MLRAEGAEGKWWSLSNLPQNAVGVVGCKSRYRKSLQLGVRLGDRQGAFSFILSWSDFCAGVTLEHCFHLWYRVNAVWIYCLPVLVSARQGWFVCTSTTGWKWASAFLTKSTMLPPTSYPQKQLRGVWNLSGKSKFCPSECGQSLLLFQVWEGTGWCGWAVQEGSPGLRQDSLELLLWLCGAAGFMVVKSHSLGVHFRCCTEGMLQEWPALFAAGNCVFILICWPRSDSAFGRKRAQVLWYLISCVCLAAKVINFCFFPFFYSILYFSNAGEQFSDLFSIVCQHSEVFFLVNEVSSYHITLSPSHRECLLLWH